jgi:hypothetical protein
MREAVVLPPRGLFFRKFRNSDPVRTIDIASLQRRPFSILSGHTMKAIIQKSPIIL